MIFRLTINDPTGARSFLYLVSRLGPYKALDFKDTTEAWYYLCETKWLYIRAVQPMQGTEELLQALMDRGGKGIHGAWQAAGPWMRLNSDYIINALLIDNKPKIIEPSEGDSDGDSNM